MAAARRRIVSRPSSKGGFTFIGALVIILIVAAALVISNVFIFSGTGAIKNRAGEETASGIADSVLGFMADKLADAKAVTRGNSNVPGGGELDYSIAKGAVLHICEKGIGGALEGALMGQLYYRPAGADGVPQNVFGNDFYQNYKVGFLLDISYRDARHKQGASFTLTVTVYNRFGHEIVSRSVTKPLSNYKGYEYNGLGGPGDFAGHFIDIVS